MNISEKILELVKKTVDDNSEMPDSHLVLLYPEQLLEFAKECAKAGAVYEGNKWTTVVGKALKTQVEPYTAKETCEQISTIKLPDLTINKTQDARD